jgi:hypothetical protein
MAALLQLANGWTSYHQNLIEPQDDHYDEDVGGPMSLLTALLQLLANM